MLFPFSSLAGEYKLNDGTIVHYEGLVPCGYDLNKDGEMQYYENCQLCHFFVMGKGILDFVLEIIIIIAVLMFVYGGITFIIATGDPGKFSKGKDIIQAAVIGVVIILAAWIVVNTIFLLIGVADWTGLREGWFKIDCPISLTGGAPAPTPTAASTPAPTPPPAPESLVSPTSGYPNDSFNLFVRGVTPGERYIFLFYNANGDETGAPIDFTSTSDVIETSFTPDMRSLPRESCITVKLFRYSPREFFDQASASFEVCPEDKSLEECTVCDGILYGAGGTEELPPPDF